ncbi:type II CRISPR RNA-guided endonuclease Cas9 [Salsuginibacillus kocurii]|uniref:type II CRISPR RNA-guided endonuclease Cas9 n=1 Tax=Salsuginibacillus kocurii TaxID=427078 RepID=UPI000362988A|nr:type II CRISPR RNA-guided endonuclease Cas9 [Salsuginibacillus kocurii]
MSDTIDYRIGLDIGTNSVGWSIVELEFNGEQYETVNLIDAGVRMFDKAEVPKTGASLAFPRRLARSTRRRLKRRANRKKAIRNLLINQDVVNEKELEKLFQSPTLIDVWSLRVEALDRLLGREEWARLLIHLAQKRGYKSNRKAEESTKEGKVVLSSINENTERLKRYRTVGEMWVEDPHFEGRFHNQENEYKFNVTRHQLEEEIRFLFKQQRELNSPYASNELEEHYLNIWGHQLPFTSGNSILNKVGQCSLLENEKRFPKATYTFQYFMVLDKLNRIRLKPSVRKLTQEERSHVINSLFNRSNIKKTPPKVKYKDIRKIIEIAEEETFHDVVYDTEKSITKNEDIPFVNLDSYYKIKKVCDEHKEEYGPADYDAVGYALTVYKTDHDIRLYLRNPENLAKRVFEEKFIQTLLLQSYSTFGHLSQKGIQAILPFMEEGMTYIEAAQQAGFNTTGFKKEGKSKFLKVIPDDIRNPVVMRSLTQSRKVVNAIIKEMEEQPQSIHVELARELSKDNDERKKISNQYEKNRKRNEGAVKILSENGILNPTGHDIVKYKLWSEQRGHCMYSLKPIPAEEFFAELKAERNRAPMLDVDHIIPYSKSFDDSYSNKVLVYSDQNRIKGDRLPVEYFDGDIDRWNEFIGFVNSCDFSKRKRTNLTKKRLNEEEEQLIKERHLNDTRYASRYFKNYLEEHLKFKVSEKKKDKKRVETVAGKITSHLRKRWGLVKHRQDTHLHHALDAVVVACTDTKIIQDVIRYYRLKEESRAESNIYFPLPWKTFRNDILHRLSLVAVPEQVKEALEGDQEQTEYMLVSRMPRRSITGAVHKETISTFGGYDEKGKVLMVQKVPLNEIKFDENGDFKMFNKESDPATYEVIKQRLLENNGDSNIAFEKPLYKPSKKGNGNEIKRVKVIKEQKTMMRQVNGGIAENGDLVRIDFFQKDKKYVMVPIYTWDTIEPVLPDKYVVGGKGYQQWPKITEDYHFSASIYPYELIRVVTKKGVDRFYYFSSLNIGKNVIKVIECNIPHQEYIEIGVNSITLLEKYEMNVLGKIKGVVQDSRNTFSNYKIKKHTQ